MNAFVAFEQQDAEHRAATGQIANPFLEDPSPRLSRFYAGSSLDGLTRPAREWAVQDLVPSGTVTLLGGDGGTGKSLLGMQLTDAVATGGRWLGL